MKGSRSRTTTETSTPEADRKTRSSSHAWTRVSMAARDIPAMPMAFPFV